MLQWSTTFIVSKHVFFEQALQFTIKANKPSRLAIIGLLIAVGMMYNLTITRINKNTH